MFSKPSFHAECFRSPGGEVGLLWCRVNLRNAPCMHPEAGYRGKDKYLHAPYSQKRSQSNLIARANMNFVCAQRTMPSLRVQVERKRVTQATSQRRVTASGMLVLSEISITRDQNWCLLAPLIVSRYVPILEGAHNFVQADHYYPRSYCPSRKQKAMGADRFGDQRWWGVLCPHSNCASCNNRSR